MASSSSAEPTGPPTDLVATHCARVALPGLLPHTAFEKVVEQGLAAGVRLWISENDVIAIGAKCCCSFVDG